VHCISTFKLDEERREEVKLERLRREVAGGFDAIDRGDFIEFESGDAVHAHFIAMIDDIDEGMKKG
jgi:hypothetical protein